MRLTGMMWVFVYVILCLHVRTSEWALCDCVNCEHVRVFARGYSCVCLCACEGWGLCGGFLALPPTPGPGRGQQRWRRLRQGDPPPRLPRPHPRPLPAGRFADRPNRQKLRTRGPLGAFLLWCELPMAGTGAGAGTRAQPNQPGHRARNRGREAARRAGGHRRRPQPQLGHAPGFCGQWSDQGRGRRGRGLVRVP